MCSMTVLHSDFFPPVHIYSSRKVFKNGRISALAEIYSMKWLLNFAWKHACLSANKQTSRSLFIAFEMQLLPQQEDCKAFGALGSGNGRTVGVLCKHQPTPLQDLSVFAIYAMWDQIMEEWQAQLDVDGQVSCFSIYWVEFFKISFN